MLVERRASVPVSTAVIGSSSVSSMCEAIPVVVVPPEKAMVPLASLFPAKFETE